MKTALIASVATFALTLGGGWLYADHKTAEVERKAAAQAAIDGSLIKRLHRFRLPSQRLAETTGFTLHALNNPLIARKAEIRAAKASAKDIGDLWNTLEPIARSFHKWGDERDTAVGAMLVVGALWDFGNPPPNDLKPGCTSINETTGLKSIGDLTFKAHMASGIGCCTDFALLLTSFLSRLGYESEILHSQVHQSARVKIGDRWHYIDANVITFIENYFQDGPKDIFYFTPYEDNRTVLVQQFMMKAMMFSEPLFKVADFKPVPLVNHYKRMRAEYLTQALMSLD